jgi:hypothetical protein
MPLGRGLSGSETRYIAALPTSGLTTASAATNASQLGGEFNWMTLIVLSDASSAQAVVQRSAASSTGFEDTGLSVVSTGASLTVRSMPLNASPTWYRVKYSTASGTANAGIILELSQPRRTPVKQSANTAVHSTVLS